MSLKPLLKLIGVPFDPDPHLLLSDVRARWKEKAVAIHPDRTGDEHAAAAWNELCQRAIELCETKAGIRRPKARLSRPVVTQEVTCRFCKRTVRVSGDRKKRVTCNSPECRTANKRLCVTRWRRDNISRVREMYRRANKKKRKISGTRGNYKIPQHSAVTVLNAGQPSPAFSVAAS